MFSLPMDASIVLTTRPHSTYIWFQWANLATPQGQPLPDCESPAVSELCVWLVLVVFVFGLPCWYLRLACVWGYLRLACLGGNEGSEINMLNSFFTKICDV